MKNILNLILAFLFFSGGTALAQKKEWSLEECIKHALDNNIQIKQQVIQTKYQKNALDLSKLRLLPTVNGSASQNYSYGRALNVTEYEFGDNDLRYNSFNLGGNMNLFDGLQNYNTIQKYKYQLLAGEQDLQSLKDNIALNVALAYLQILLNNELVTAASNQIDITRQQIQKIRRMVDAGSLARGNLLQIEAQAAGEEVQLTNFANQLELSYLNLTQMLELNTPAGFTINTPEIEIDTNTIISGDISEIFMAAQELRPEVRSAEMMLAASEYDRKIAVGARSPQLTLNHFLSTDYAKVLGQTAKPFNDQVKDNFRYGFGFSLNIPILNGWQVNKNISNSRLAVENNQYALEGTKKQLYKNIQQAYSDAVAALKKYNSSLKAVVSTQESFRYTEERFNVGMVTPVDYNAAKTQLLNAQSDMAQAKYEFIFKTKVLDFYKGIPLNLNN
jgi:outer membrane protein